MDGWTGLVLFWVSLYVLGYHWGWNNKMAFGFGWGFRSGLCMSFAIMIRL